MREIKHLHLLKTGREKHQEVHHRPQSQSYAFLVRNLTCQGRGWKRCQDPLRHPHHGGSCHQQSSGAFRGADGEGRGPLKGRTQEGNNGTLCEAAQSATAATLSCALGVVEGMEDYAGVDTGETST